MEVTKELSSAGIAYADLLHLPRSGRATHSTPPTPHSARACSRYTPQVALSLAIRPPESTPRALPQPTRHLPGRTLLAVITSNTLNLAEAAKAHELLESGSVTGKIALTV
jgi:hypothetical protein